MEYCKQFHLNPDSFTVSLQTWARWLLISQALRAREAVAHSRRSDDWEQQLSASELALKRWAEK